MFLIHALDEFGREIESQRRNKKADGFLGEMRFQETEWVPFGGGGKKPATSRRQVQQEETLTLLEETAMPSAKKYASRLHDKLPAAI